MPYEAKILLDSLSPNGVRLTTFEINYPRFVHSELMTHRVFSRNSSSSRAIPIQKMIEQVQNDPAGPVWWGKNQSGMQAKEELTGVDLYESKKLWIMARDESVQIVRQMIESNLHKQIVNRLLEPWMWIRVIVTATEWENWFNLRVHPDAQPEIEKIAHMMRDLYWHSSPKSVEYDDWHLPLVIGNDIEQLYETGYSVDDIVKICIGRCARVSYLTHDGKRDPQSDIDLYTRLVTNGHMSPTEHAAQAKHVPSSYWSGNFRGWIQHRKMIPGENVFMGKNA